jgi:hypothetical protein
MLRLQMFLTSLPQTRASREALEVWRAAAHLVSARWQTFLDAGPETRRLAFASYLAALDAEEAAAADTAALAACDRDVVHLRIEGSAMPDELRAVMEPCERFNGPAASTSTPSGSEGSIGAR